ncbi:hypothetical protein D3C87_904040 [compost metagenome]
MQASRVLLHVEGRLGEQELVAEDPAIGVDGEALVHFLVEAVEIRMRAHVRRQGDEGHQVEIRLVEGNQADAFRGAMARERVAQHPRAGDGIADERAVAGGVQG